MLDRCLKVALLSEGIRKEKDRDLRLTTIIYKMIPCSKISDLPNRKYSRIEASTNSIGEYYEKVESCAQSLPRPPSYLLTRVIPSAGQLPPLRLLYSGGLPMRPLEDGKP